MRARRALHGCLDAAGLSRGSSDSSTDAGTGATQDVSPNADAGLAEAGDGSTRGCDGITPTPWLCSGFDTSAEVTADGWNGAYMQTSGALSIDGVGARSAPNSLLAIVEPTSLQAISAAGVYRNAIAHRLTCSLSWRVERFGGTTSKIQLLSWAWGATPYDDCFSSNTVEIDSTGNVTVEERAASRSRGGLLLADDAWHRLTMDLDLAAGTASVSADGKSVYAGPLDAASKVQSAQLAVGPLCVGQIAPGGLGWRVRFDDVVCDKP